MVIAPAKLSRGRMLRGWTSSAAVCLLEVASMNPASASFRYFPSGITRQVDVSPDGRWAVYSLQTDRGERGSIDYADLRNGSRGTILEEVDFPPELMASPAMMRPQWSPDSRFVAYLAPRNGRMMLHIWDHSLRRSTTAEGSEACARSCLQYRLQWSPDSSSVYFISTKPRAGEVGAPRLAADTDVSRALLDVRVRALGFDPSSDLTVLDSPSVAPERLRRQSFTQPSSVMAYSIESRTLCSVLTGGEFDQISLSPNGRHLLAIATTDVSPDSRQMLRSLYLVPAIGNVNASGPCHHRDAGERDARDDAVRDSNGDPVAPVVTNFRQWANIAAWSPDSTRFAVVELGALARGDVYTYELATNHFANLTGALDLPPQRGEESLTAESATPSRLFDYRGKFGEAFRGPIWTSDGRFLILRRRDQGSAGTSLWRLDLTGNAERFELPNDVDVGDIAEANGAAIQISPGIYMAIANRHAAGAPDERLLVHLEPERLRASIAASSPGQFLRDRMALSGDGSLLVIGQEGPQSAPSLHVSAPVTGRDLRRVNVNGSFEAPPFTRSQFRYRLADQNRIALIYLPERRPGPDRRPPVVLLLYPGREESIGAELGRHVHNPANLEPPLADLLARGYAVMKANVPLPGRGRTCAAVTAATEAALDAAARQFAINPDRAGLIGYSFGGWAVNCVVTHSSRFAAAVSGAGLANLFSERFSSARLLLAGYGGGGQAAIGAEPGDQPDLYVAESPVFHARNAAAPLLLIHGAEDVIAPVEQSIEMFVALRDQGKVARLVTIAEAGHRSLVNSAAYRDEVLAWFDRYLQNGP